MHNRNFIKSLGKGISLIELLCTSSEPLSLTQIAQLMDTNKTTAQRFLHTLQELGYVCQVTGKRYVLGNKVLSMAFQFLHSKGAFNIARPYLEELSNDLERSVSMGVLDDTEVLVIFRKERTRFYPFAVYVGSRVPTYCTTMGKILLAALPQDKLAELLSRVKPYKATPKTKTNKSEIIKDLKVTRKRGYAITDQEFSLDLYSFGAPLLNHEGQVVASVSISLNVQVRENKKVAGHALARLLQTGEIISQGLGYKGPYPIIPLTS